MGFCATQSQSSKYLAFIMMFSYVVLYYQKGNHECFVWKLALTLIQSQQETSWPFIKITASPSTSSTQSTSIFDGSAFSVICSCQLSECETSGRFENIKYVLFNKKRKKELRERWGNSLNPFWKSPCRYFGVWLIFFMLGLGTLLPWNFFMTATVVWHHFLSFIFPHQLSLIKKRVTRFSFLLCVATKSCCKNSRCNNNSHKTCFC